VTPSSSRSPTVRLASHLKQSKSHAHFPPLSASRTHSPFNTTPPSPSHAAHSSHSLTTTARRKYQYRPRHARLSARSMASFEIEILPKPTPTAAGSHPTDIRNIQPPFPTTSRLETAPISAKRTVEESNPDRGGDEEEQPHQPTRDDPEEDGAVDTSMTARLDEMSLKVQSLIAQGQRALVDNPPEEIWGRWVDEAALNRCVSNGAPAADTVRGHRKKGSAGSRRTLRTTQSRNPLSSSTGAGLGSTSLAPTAAVAPTPAAAQA
jgi:hypothetical protein